MSESVAVSPLKAPKEIVLKLANGLRVAGKSWGSASSPVKVLGLHGWLDNSSTHDALAPLMASHGIHIVCIDFIGHGRSQHAPQEVDPYYMYYVLQVIDTGHALGKGWESFHIMAHSMGAGVASLVASVAPDMVRSLILFDGIGPLSSNISSAKQLEDAIRDRRAFLNRKPKIYASISDCVKKLQQNNSDLAEHTAKAIVQRGTIQVEGGYQFCHDPRLLSKSLTVFREKDVLGYLERIRCPVLLMWAQTTVDRYKVPSEALHQQQKNMDPPEEETTEQRPEEEPKKKAGDPKDGPRHISLALKQLQIDRRMQAVQHLTCITVPGSHHVHSDNPDAVLPHILKFLLPPKSKL